MESEPPLPELLALIGLLFPLAFSWGIAWSIALLILLLIASALISGSEVAYYSLTPQELHDLDIEGSASSQRILALRAIPDKMLATILIANNFVNIAIVLVSNFITLKTIPPATYDGWSSALNAVAPFSLVAVDTLSLVINFVITTVFVTFLLVLFGEIAPKIYAKMNNVQLARFMSSPLTFLVRFFTPMSHLLVMWSDGLERRIRNSNSGSGGTDKEDIDKAIDLAMTQTEGDSSKIEADILKGIIKFNDVSVKQIMRARVDVIAVDKTTPYDELLQTIKTSGYSRIPIYEEDFDSVIGMLYVKDLIAHRHEGPGYRWQKLVQNEVLYVPESKKINDLLKAFQEEHKHMAIVVDEYGGSSGLVTLEDVMEEVLGEITDEFDIGREDEFKRIDEFTYVFDGKTLINDACRIMHRDSSIFDDVRGDADSLAGLVLEVSRGMPKKGEDFEINNVNFTVLSVTRRRIEKIRIRLDDQNE